MDCILAFDVGGTLIKAALVTTEGRLVELRRVETPGRLVDFQDALRELARSLTGGHNVIGVGIGCKGLIDPADTRVLVLPGSLHFLEGSRLSEFVGLPQSVPVHADNDARVAMAGERVWGAARNCSNALLLTLGTGVGGAILCDGRLLRGATGVAGHLGHLTVEVDGEPCICGNRGCLETVFSARAIESAAFAAAHRGVESRLAERSTCAEVFALARGGDAIAQGIVTNAIRVLAGAIAGLAHAVDPEVIIISGQIAQAGESLLEPLSSEVWSRTRLMLRREVRIVKSELEDPSGVIGAAALVMLAASTG